MRTELFHSSLKIFLSLIGAVLVSACAAPRGTGDLGIIIERASGSVQVVMVEILDSGDVSVFHVMEARQIIVTLVEEMRNR